METAENRISNDILHCVTVHGMPSFFCILVSKGSKFLHDGLYAEIIFLFDFNM